MRSEFHLVVEKLFGFFPSELEGKLRQAFARIPRTEQDDFLAALALELVLIQNRVQRTPRSNSESPENEDLDKPDSVDPGLAVSKLIITAVERVKKRIFRELDRQRRQKAVLLEKQQRQSSQSTAMQPGYIEFFQSLSAEDQGLLFQKLERKKTRQTDSDSEEESKQQIAERWERIQAEFRRFTRNT